MMDGYETRCGVNIRIGDTVIVTQTKHSGRCGTVTGCVGEVAPGMFVVDFGDCTNALIKGDEMSVQNWLADSVVPPQSIDKAEGGDA